LGIFDNNPLCFIDRIVLKYFVYNLPFGEFMAFLTKYISYNKSQ